MCRENELERERERKEAKEDTFKRIESKRAKKGRLAICYCFPSPVFNVVVIGQYPINRDRCNFTSRVCSLRSAIDAFCVSCIHI